jgi:hypothetical protein
MKFVLYIALSLAFVRAPAVAAPDPTAERYFASGEYEAAAEQALSVGDAEDLALAARALNAKAYLEIDDKSAKRIAKRASKIADEAAERDPMLVEAYLQGAIAMAQRASRISAVRAFFLGLGGGARERLDKALELEPENPWALSTSAGWHLGVATRAGNGRFGSDAETGYLQFKAARAADPDNISIAYEMGLRVLAFGEEAWRAEAIAALERAQTAPPLTAFDEALQARAKDFAAAIAAGPESERAFIDEQP